MPVTTPQDARPSSIPTTRAGGRRLRARLLVGVTAVALSVPLGTGMAQAAPSEPCNPQSSAPCSGPNVVSGGQSKPADTGEVQPEDEVSNELAACGTVYLPCAGVGGFYDAGKNAAGLR